MVENSQRLDQNSYFSFDKNVNNIGETQHGKPWLRFWARYIDFVLFATLFSLLLGNLLIIYSPSTLDKIPDYIFVMLVLFFWVFIEPILLCTWGTTPGKKILNIKLNDLNGKRLTFQNALTRSFKTWFIGLGTGFPIMSIFTLFLSYKKLKKNGVAIWDKGYFVIHYRKISITKIIFAVTISMLPLLSIYLMLNNSN